MSGWSIPTALRQGKAAARREQAVAMGGVRRKVAARHLGVSERTISRYLRDAR